MAIDATFWVAVSFIIFFGALIYIKIPQKISEMLDKLLSLSKVKNIKIKKDPKRIRPIDADLQIPDTSKFMNHTGWKPKISFNDLVINMVEHDLENIDEF